ncbi:MAG: HNH endonuclease [Anaerolineae bacterium]|nr:HNH endonuclease [Anaerolineae bacterium]
MARIPGRLRRQVISRAHGRCEYCQTQQAIVIAMEIDHILPESAGGETSLANLCLACIGCNGFKLNHQTGLDSETGQEAPLFNPRTQQWREHFAWSPDGASVVGLTATGRATVERLRMNRETVVAARRLWVEAGWHPPADRA